MFRLIKRLFVKENKPKELPTKYLYDFSMYKELNEFKNDWKKGDYQ